MGYIYSIAGITFNIMEPPEPPPQSDRAVFGSGGGPVGKVAIIDYIVISTISNAINFGDVTVSRSTTTACSNGANERGVFEGGWVSASPALASNTIDYITINSAGNATDFGDLTLSKNGNGGTDNNTNERGIHCGGYTDGPLSTDVIDYITINSPGNATDFGNQSVKRTELAGTSNCTNERGVFGGGWTGANSNIIDYITINSAGNAINFGDLTVARNFVSACSNGANERGVFAGLGNTIDYITINSTGNATDFGDLTVTRQAAGGTSNNTDERGVFAGDYGYYLFSIDYITINSTGNASDFGDLTYRRGGVGATSNA